MYGCFRSVFSFGDLVMANDLAAKENLICAVIDAHAKFTERLVSLILSNSERSTSEEPGIRSGEPTLEDAPAWVQEEYAKSKANSEPGEDIARVGRRIARNSIVVKMRQRGLTQKQLAERAGMKPNSVSRILKDPERSRVSTIRKLADALEADISNLL